MRSFPLHIRYPVSTDCGHIPATANKQYAHISVLINLTNERNYSRNLDFVLSNRSDRLNNKHFLLTFLFIYYQNLFLGSNIKLDFVLNFQFLIFRSK